MIIPIPKTSFTGGVWAPSLYGRFDLETYMTAMRMSRNCVVAPHGPTSNRGGSEVVCELTNNDKKGRLIKFQFSTTQSYMLVFEENILRVIKDGGLVLDGAGPTVYSVVTTYAEADLPYLVVTQSADVLTITHKSYKTQTLTRTDHDAWTLADAAWGADIDPPENLANSGSGINYKVTTVTSIGEESIASELVNGAADSSTTWDAVDGADVYNVYKEGNVSGTYGWIGQADSNKFKEPASGIDPDYDRTPPKNVVPFGTEDNYPACCAYHEQRQVFGRTNNKPQSVQGSVTASYENFNRSTPLLATDAYEFMLASQQVNEIRWLCPSKDLLIGTSDGVWMLSPGGNVDAITPMNKNMELQNAWGVSYLQPIKIGDSVLFVENDDEPADDNVVDNVAGVRDLMYKFEVDKYTTNDLTLMASHLFEDRKIVSWCYQRRPDSIVWAVTDDGSWLGLTYYREHKVWGWHEHNTQGVVEDIESLDGTSEVYMIVKRTIEDTNGDPVVKRYVERRMARMPTGDVEDAWFLDCALKYEGAEVTTISGLDHLMGLEVVVLANGNVVTGLTVDTDGEITLPNPTTKALIGLGYTAEGLTLDFEAQTQQGSTMGKVRT
ncbi:MAG: hypothetical protein KAS32_00765, partial [Candidatus Peribacteraceae bacterium]|nr:hypothetical protein [Candidatus Peribacteraceae bacterium]